MLWVQSLSPLPICSGSRAHLGDACNSRLFVDRVGGGEQYSQLCSRGRGMVAVVAGLREAI